MSLYILCCLGSASYDDAVKELKIFFPQGLCCKPTIDLEAEQVSVEYFVFI